MDKTAWTIHTGSKFRSMLRCDNDLILFFNEKKPKKYKYKHEIKT